MEHSGIKAKPRRRSYTGTVSHGPETPRQQNRLIGKGITRENSLKMSYNAKSDNSSRIYPDDISRNSRARRNSFDTSELSVINAETKSCCNMKMSDLLNENYRDKVYNSFEASIIEERKGSRARHPGRSITSIRKNPSVHTLSLTGFTKMSSSIGQFRAMTMITENILLGGTEDAENAAQLLEYGVTHILNTAQQLPNYFPQHFVYLKVGLLDATSANVVEVMESVVSFLSHVERVQGRVLLHCLAGVSRSVSVLLMHLMVRHRLPLQHAFRYVRSCRPQINPNEAFKLQLAKLEVQELRCSSVAKDADKVWDFYEWNNIKRTMPTSRVPQNDGAAADNDSSDRLVIDSLPYHLQQQDEMDTERNPSADGACCIVS